MFPQIKNSIFFYKDTYLNIISISNNILLLIKNLKFVIKILKYIKYINSVIIFWSQKRTDFQ